jgi:hypothetical protein
MEISDVRRRVRDTIQRARQDAAARRARNESAERAWLDLRDRIVVPVCQQVVQVLRPEGFPFQLSTPGETVRITHERGSEDFMELRLDTSAEPVVVCRAQRVRGREILENERQVAAGTPIESITSEQVLEILMEVLLPFVER